MITLLAFVITHISSQELKQVDIIFDLDDFQIIPDGDNAYSIETLESGYYYPEDHSLPAIPLKSIRVLVPNGAELLDFQIETEEEIVKEDIILSKATIPVPTNSMDFIEKPGSEFKGIYPENPVEFKAIMIQRGLTWFSFVSYPFRYDGHKRELTIIRRIRLKVEYRINNENFSIIRKDAALVQSLKRRLSNPEDMDRFYPPSSMSVQKSVQDELDYLVLTTEEFKNELGPLLEWKARKGLVVDVLTLKEIDGRYRDENIQLKIKRCLKEYYRDHGLQWVLLAGDHDHIPVQYCYSEISLNFSGVICESIPTDLFYACYDKCFNWNCMNDDNIGQKYFDYVDLVPEIHISRIPVRTPEQMRNFVEKILYYETRQQESGQSGRLLLAGVKSQCSWDGRSDSHHRSERIYDKYVAGNFKGEKKGFFDTGTDFPKGDAYQVTASNLAARLNKGYGIFHYAGHGNTTRVHMESGPGFDIYNASELKNPLTGIILSSSCGVSAFDASGPCLAEAFLMNPEGGCVAFFGSSRYGFSNPDTACKLGPSLNYNASFFKYLFEEETGFAWKSFARISSLAKTDFAERSTNGGTYHYLLYSINALGDPEMPLFTTTPSGFNNVQIDRLGNSITVNTGIESNSRICITSLDLGMGYQQVVENVPSHTFEDVPEKFQVTITAPNYIPYRYISDLVSRKGKDDMHNIRIFPNPTIGLLTVHVPGSGSYSLEINSLNGHLLQSIDVAEGERKIDLSNFQKGIFFISIRTRNYVKTEKIIKL